MAIMAPRSGARLSRAPGIYRLIRCSLSRRQISPGDIIWMKTLPAFDDGTVIPECGMISLGDDMENLNFNIVAWHENGFLRNYELSVFYGKNKDAGDVAADQYAGSNDSSPPDWQGVKDTFDSLTAMKSGDLDVWHDPGCAYQFHLRAWARTMDGFTHIRSATFNDHYYIQISPVNQCLADLDNSGAVDGEDLRIFAEEYGTTGCW